MNINDLIHEYATLELQNRKLLAVVDAAKELAEFVPQGDTIAEAAKKSIMDTPHKSECVGESGIICKCWQQPVWDAIKELER